MLFQEFPKVSSSHPEEESPMMEAWRDQQGQKRKATALAITAAPETSLEHAISFIPLPVPRTAVSNIIQLVQPIIRSRPGKTADGEPITKEYFFRVRSSDALWLKGLHDRWQIALPKLMLGVGLGWWSLPWRRMELPPVLTSKEKSTLSIHLRDDQWGQLCANAVAANPQNPDPVRYCVMATLGRVVVPKPGPVLLTTGENMVMQSLYRAVQLGHRTNLLSQFHPDMGRLENARTGLRRRIEQNGVNSEDTEYVTRLHSLLKKLQDKADLCACSGKEWEEFHNATAKIAVPKLQNIKELK